MVTGPMPRKPNATRPKAKTGAASIMPMGNVVLKMYPMPIRTRIARPSQYALKFPAMKPDKMFSDAPPSREDATTSRTCRESVEVKTFTNSGMIAPASVPHVMIEDNFHHIEVSPPRSGIRIKDKTYVKTTETIEVSHTSDVSGASKFILAAFSYFAFATAAFTK